MSKVRTRFAPSPTGFLHIGGLRTALFSFLFARHNNGDFLLRIEDTDRSRYVEGALNDIIESLKWIGIVWDEGPDVGGPYGPYKQSERKDIYKEHAFDLVRTGHAYKCFCSPERLAALREEQKKKGIYPGYDRHCRYLSKEEVLRHEKNKDPFVIRLKIPEDGETVFEDSIRGTIKTANSTLDDTVLLKSDEFPTYHLANVIDDHLMEISHVIRGDEWISSTPRHIILYRSFDWAPPVFAHVPVILAQGGGKLSKRHGATTVREFRNNGYLPGALLNFISLLGWALDDRTELFTMDDLIAHFDLERVNKSPAVFSYEKLDWFNGVYLRRKKTDELYDLILPFMIEGNLFKKEEIAQYKEYILQIIPLIQERLTSLKEVVDRTWFFFDQLFTIKEKDTLIPKKGTPKDAIKILERTIEVLSPLSSFHEDELEKAFRALVDDLGMKTGAVFMTVRVAITGTRVSPGLFETMNVMGKDRVIQRLREAKEIVKNMT